MTDQKKARDLLGNILREADYRGLDTDETVDAVLSADPRVIAEAMGGELRVERVFYSDTAQWWIRGGSRATHEQATIVLPPRKVES